MTLTDNHLPLNKRRQQWLDAPIQRRIHAEWVNSHHVVRIITYDTCHPALCTHANPFDINSWCVTHRTSGMTIAQGLPSFDAGLMMAGALADILPWGSSPSVIKDAFRHLHPSIQQWMLTLNQDRLPL